ncbi:hypothetical protein STCU_00189 [Strigomonas culicis]|uniref:Uncharacterized protein n=1 Tax=Strigomonas culicis TaxID=28005 RepID=S9V8K9_9TRYP|nr:hypothetical protein STCU_00189 [Strigomonas culicis]|eukprot:EPY37108.1 hypothetical protein STCU_00189 [Strigomonas culicis]
MILFMYLSTCSMYVHIFILYIITSNILLFFSDYLSVSILRYKTHVFLLLLHCFTMQITCGYFCYTCSFDTPIVQLFPLSTLHFDIFLLCSFVLPVFIVTVIMLSFKNVIHHWIEKGVITCVLSVLIIYAGSVMTFFGSNFFLWSFPEDIEYNYVSIAVPSLIWLALCFFMMACILARDKFYRKHMQSYFFWCTRRGLLLLVLIGAFDSLTGLTGMYATPHVPQVLQSALVATGPVWTYILALVIFPSSQTRLHPLLFVVLALICGGVVLALLPQVLDTNSGKSYFSAPWTIIYLLATVLFPLYNVLQGRFINDFEGACDEFTLRMIMLTVETFIQLFLTIGYFPVDFSPFFGSSSSAAESWRNFVASLDWIGSSKRTAGFLLLHVFGFWIRHVAFAYLNGISPTLASVANLLSQPINTFFLLVIPSWNVYGSTLDYRFTLGCFLCLLFAMLLYTWWHVRHAPGTKRFTGHEHEDGEEMEDTKKFYSKQIVAAIGDEPLEEFDALDLDVEKHIPSRHFMLH